MSAQLELSIQLPTVKVLRCKERGCAAEVVGSSISGKGHVCKGHNEIEWGKRLVRSTDPHYRRLGARLVADGGAR